MLTIRCDKNFWIADFSNAEDQNAPARLFFREGNKATVIAEVLYREGTYVIAFPGSNERIKADDNRSAAIAIMWTDRVKFVVQPQYKAQEAHA